MEKILLAIDSSQINMVPIDFACWLAKLTNSKLTGVFLEHNEGIRVPVVKLLHGMAYAETNMSEDIADSQIDEKNCGQYIDQFEAECNRRNVRSSVHRNNGKPLRELVSESRFADLLVADPEMSFELNDVGAPSNFVESLLQKTECPVILSPLDFEGIDEIVLAYDGSASSLFAIKQFTYLLPELSDKRVMVVQVHKNDTWSITARKQIGEFLQPHYSAVGFDILKGDADDALFKYLVEKKRVLLVMGAYGRPVLSRFFRRSTASLLVRTLNLPVFIAHQ